MLASVQSCLCGMLSEMRAYRQDGYLSMSEAEGRMGIERVITQISSRAVQLEVLDRKCINEARRHKELGAKVQFRSKMIEHRRLQNQMTQLQKFRESALTHLDAVSNQEINQTFIRASQSAGKAGANGIKIKEVKSVLDGLHETVSHSNELSELLGERIGEEITDEDLDLEFMDISIEETITVAPEPVVSLPSVPVATTKVPARTPELRIQEMFSMS